MVPQVRCTSWHGRLVIVHAHLVSVEFGSLVVIEEDVEDVSRVKFRIWFYEEGVGFGWLVWVQGG